MRAMRSCLGFVATSLFERAKFVVTWVIDGPLQVSLGVLVTCVDGIMVLGSIRRLILSDFRRWFKFVVEWCTVIVGVPLFLNFLFGGWFVFPFMWMRVGALKIVNLATRSIELCYSFVGGGSVDALGVQAFLCDLTIATSWCLQRCGQLVYACVGLQLLTNDSGQCSVSKHFVDSAVLMRFFVQVVSRSRLCFVLHGLIGVCDVLCTLYLDYALSLQFMDFIWF
eukprot:gene3073-2055_t